MLAESGVSWGVRAAALEAVMKMSLPDQVQRISIYRDDCYDRWLVTLQISGMEGLIEIKESYSEDGMVFPIKNVLDKIRAFL
jgi:hypothetical protein